MATATEPQEPRRNEGFVAGARQDVGCSGGFWTCQPGGRLGELQARPGTDAVHRIDLLTAVIHEMGHLLGHDHADHGLMQQTLGLGIRRLTAGEEGLVLATRQTALDDASFEPDRLDAFFAQLQ